jgi:DNA-binding MarR family transcriptional regulator
MNAPTPEGHVLTGLAKLGLALRHEAWRAGSLRGLTPTQAQVLAMLARGSGPRLAELAAELGVSAASASDSVAALVARGLVRKSRASTDGRALRLALTASGRRAAERASEWPDALLATAAELAPDEQGLLLRLLTKLIRGLQVAGRIPPARMCASCRFFRPHAHPGSPRPHHCAFVDAAFGEHELRLECAEHEHATPEVEHDTWDRFVSGAAHR